MMIFNRMIFACLIITELFFCRSLYAQNSPQEAEKKRILILHSYNEGLSWTESIDRGMRSVLLKYPDFDLYFEYMDTKRREDELLFKKLYELFELKYASKKIELILCSDDNALNFLLRFRKKLFPGAKVVFCGINNYKPEIREKNPDITGVVEALHAEATIELAIKLHPDLKKILVVADKTETSQTTLKTVKETVVTNSYKVNFEYLDNYSMIELQNRVAALQSDTAIILLPCNKDRDGKFFEFAEFSAALSKRSARPIYSYWDFYLGHGITGGFLISGFAQGEASALIAERILKKGEDIKNIPVVTRSPNVYEFDHQYLRIFKILPDSLPPHSKIVNEPVSIFVKNESTIKVVIIILFAIVIIFLIISPISARFVIKKLQEKDDKMQKELDLASDIQKGMLPETPYRLNGLNLVAFYNSMGKVGGDFYDIFPMSEGYTGMVIADVSGHGIPAAFITALAKISFQEASMKYRFPKDIFAKVNEDLIKTIRTNEYLTAFLVVISPSYEIYYGNASHQKGIIVRKNSMELLSLDSHGLFVGAISEATDMYEEKNDVLNFGDRLFLFTDGLTESRNVADEEFGLERLHKILLQTINLSIDEARDNILEVWKNFVKDREIKDDVSFILLEIDPAYKSFLEHKNRAVEFMYQNKTSAAIKELEQALLIDNENLDVQLLIGKSLFNEHMYARAIDHLKKYLSKNNSDAQSWYLLGICYYNNRQFKEAADASHYACQLKPNFLKSYMLLGKAQKKTGKDDLAKQAWERVIALDPSNMMARQELETSRSV